MNLDFVWKFIGKSKLNKETFWAFIAKFISVVLGMVIVIIVPRMASVEVYGIFALLLAYQAILGIFFGNTIQTAVNKEIAEGKFDKTARDFFFEGIRLKIFLSLFSSMIFFFTLGIIDIQIIKQHFLSLIILIIVMNLWGSVVSAFESSHKLFYEAVIYFIEYVVKLIIIIFFINSITVEKLLFSFIAGYFLAFVVGFFMLIRKFKNMDLTVLLRINIKNAKIILRRGFFLAIAGISMILLSKIDIIMISIILNNKEVGFYSIASDIIKQATILSAPIILGILPFFAQKEIKNLFNKSVKKLILINLGLFFIILLFSDFIVRIIYGGGFEEVSWLMRLLSLFPLLAVLQNFIQGVMILKDKTKQIFIFALLAATLNIVLNYILIIAIGVSGAAIATIISYLAWLGLSFIYLRNNILRFHQQF